MSNKMPLWKRMLYICWIPLLFLVVILPVTYGTGNRLFPSNNVFTSFMITSATITLTTFALSINLSTGRFDFSLGSIATLSAVIGARLSYLISGGDNGYTALLMLAITLLVSFLLGAASGALYVLLKIPPIITSLGVALIYEGLAFLIANGSSVFAEVRNPGMSFVASNWWVALLFILVALAVMYIVFDRSKFGYDYKAIKEGQKVAVDTGLKEKGNAILCYAIAGALMGVVGYLTAAQQSTISVDILNFGSISTMFVAFLPMFIGGYIGMFSNDKLGYVIAGFCLGLLSAMFALFTTKIASTINSLVQAFLLVVFLIFLNNRDRLRQIISPENFRKMFGVHKKEEKEGE